MLNSFIDLSQRVFLLALRTGAAASLLSLFVIPAVHALNRHSRGYSYYLWLIVFARLLLPVSADLPVPYASGAAPAEESRESAVERYEESGYIHADSPSYPFAVDGEHEQALSQSPPDFQPSVKVSAKQLLPAAYILFTAFLLIKHAAGYLRLRRKLSTAVRVKNEIYLTVEADTAFTFGLLHPKIYLPFGLDDNDERIMTAHERCHISAGDHIIKEAAYVLLCVYWVSPLIWLCYILLCRDMEYSCDERAVAVISRLTGSLSEAKRLYGTALLNCASSRSFVSQLSFGSSPLSKRIKRLMTTEGTIRSRGTLAAAALLLLVPTACSFIRPVSENGAGGIIQTPLTAAAEEKAYGNLVNGGFAVKEEGFYGSYYIAGGADEETRYSTTTLGNHPLPHGGEYMNLDGEYIYFCGDEENDGLGSVYRMSTVDGELETLYTSQEGYVSYLQLADESLYFVDGGAKAYSMDKYGEHIKPEIEGFSSIECLSVCGRYMSFIAEEYFTGSGRGLYIKDLDAGTAYCADDGEALFAFCAEDGVYYYLKNGSGGDIIFKRFDSGEKQTLCHAGFPQFNVYNGRVYYLDNADYQLAEKENNLTGSGICLCSTAIGENGTDYLCTLEGINLDRAGIIIIENQVLFTIRFFNEEKGFGYIRSVKGIDIPSPAPPQSPNVQPMSVALYQPDAAQLEELRQNSSLRKLEITAPEFGKAPTASDLVYLRDLPQLEALSINIRTYGEYDFDALFDLLSELRNIHILELNIEDHANNGFDEESFAKLGNITELSAFSGLFGDCSFIRLMPQLRRLRIPYCDSQALLSVPELEALDIAYMSEEVSFTASRLPRLRELRLHYYILPDLSFISRFENLEELHIDHVITTRYDLSPVAELKKLRILTLCLGDSFDGDEFYSPVSDISALAPLTGLEYIDLHGCTVSDISVLAGMKELTEINLSYTPVESLAPLFSLDRLDKLDVTGCTVLTEETAILMEKGVTIIQ